MTNRTEASMHSPNIDETVVKQYLKDLGIKLINKSPSPDGYHHKLLVKFSDQICKPLTEILRFHNQWGNPIPIETG